MEKQNPFLSEIADHLVKIHPDILNSPVVCEDDQFLMQYAEEKELHNTAAALPLLRWLMQNAADHPDSRFRSAYMHIGYFRHSLSVCRILIDLHCPLSSQDEDILLASALCHILPENIHFDDLKAVMVDQFGLSPQVFETVQTLFWKDNDSGAEQLEYYNRIQERKLALLIKLADRGNLAEQLHGMAGWSAHKYIQETKVFFFPMCIYAKEHYPELLAPISVLMEKMRCLIEVSEILLSRYEAREAELTQDILALKEENATIRRMIRTLKSRKG